MKSDMRLVSAGLTLFFLALLTGLLLVASPAFVDNPRGLMSGHVEGVLNGMFLMLVGLFFGRVRLSAGLTRLCRGTLLYGTFANWILSSLSGIVGASQGTPLSGAGHSASPGVEHLIVVGLVSVALSMVVAVGLLIVGVRGADAPQGGVADL